MIIKVSARRQCVRSHALIITKRIYRDSKHSHDELRLRVTFCRVHIINELIQVFHMLKKNMKEKTRIILRLKFNHFAWDKLLKIAGAGIATDKNWRATTTRSHQAAPEAVRDEQKKRLHRSVFFMCSSARRNNRETKLRSNESESIIGFFFAAPSRPPVMRPSKRPSEPKRKPTENECTFFTKTVCLEANDYPQWVYLNFRFGVKLMTDIVTRINLHTRSR